MTVINLDEMDKQKQRPLRERVPKYPVISVADREAKEERQKLLEKFAHLQSITAGNLVVSSNTRADYVYFEIGNEMTGIKKEIIPDFLAAIQALVDEV